MSEFMDDLVAHGWTTEPIGVRPRGRRVPVMCTGCDEKGTGWLSAASGDLHEVSIPDALTRGDVRYWCHLCPVVPEDPRVEQIVGVILPTQRT